MSELVDIYKVSRMIRRAGDVRYDRYANVPRHFLSAREAVKHCKHSCRSINDIYTSRTYPNDQLIWHLTHFKEEVSKENLLEYLNDPDLIYYTHYSNGEDLLVAFEWDEEKCQVKIVYSKRWNDGTYDPLRHCIKKADQCRKSHPY